MKYINSITLCIIMVAMNQLNCKAQNLDDKQILSESDKVTQAATNPAKSGEWSTMTKVAAGLAGGAVVAGAIHLYDPNAFSQLAEQTNDLINWLSHESKTELTHNKTDEKNKASKHDLATAAETAQRENQNHIEEQSRIAKIEVARLAKEEQDRIEIARLAAEKEKARLAEIARLAKELEERNKLYTNLGLATTGIGFLGLGAYNAIQNSTTSTPSQTQSNFQSPTKKSPTKKIKELTGEEKFVDQAQQEAQLLTTINETIFKISQPQYNSISKNLVAVTGKIESINEYVKSYSHQNENIKKIITKNLQPYQFVINSRGDGNCGYRAFIISALMNNPETMPDYFTSLLNNSSCYL